MESRGAPALQDGSPAAKRSVRTGGLRCLGGAKELALYDVVIVGGGFGGAYAAYQLRKARPDLDIVILEKEEAIGGRLYSEDDQPQNSYNKNEVGGMRVFEHAQAEVAALVTELGLHLVPVPLTDKNNWFYARGKRVKKSEFLINGRRPAALIEECKARFQQANPAEAALPPYDSTELRNLSLGEFLRKYGAEQDEVDQWFTYSGYDIFSSDQVQASVFFHEGELYGSKLDLDQRYVQEGFQVCVKEMIERSGAKLELEAEVERISRGPRGLTSVHFRNEVGETECVCAKHVVCALPYDAINKLSARSIIPARRKALIRDSALIVPLFKCFLEWERPEGGQQWWEARGFTSGKSTTDLNIRQIHYYDGEDCLLYCSGRYAQYWDRRFKMDVKAAARDMFAQIKEVHGLQDIPEPIWDDILFMFWPNGSHKWRKGFDINKTKHLICNGKDDASNIHVVGDAFSSQQGWVAGCVETGNIVVSAILAGLEKPKQSEAQKK